MLIYAPANSTARFAPSSIVSTGVIPASARMRRPSSSFVPVKRMTSGTLRDFVVFSASTMPLATSSPRVMPPKMLMKNTFASVWFIDEFVAVAHAFRVRAAADVEEVGDFAAGDFHRVHRAHRKAGAVGHRADGSAEAAEVADTEARFRSASVSSSSSGKRFLPLFEFGMTEERVVIDLDLRVGGDHAAVFGEHRAD